MASRSYECPRCGHVASQLGVYRKHIARKRMCSASKQAVIPTVHNAIIRMKNADGDSLVLSNTTFDVTVDNRCVLTNSNHNTITNATNNNNNNINIQVMTAGAVSVPPKPSVRFPHQDLDHLTDEFERAIVDMARKADGFARAVHRMLDVTYFQPAQSHNMNVVIADAMAHVICRNGTWSAVTADSAIKDMLDTQGDAIRNFPDDPGLEGTIPDDHVRAIDEAYDEGSFKDDPVLLETIRAKAGESRDEVNARLGNFANLALGLALSKQLEGKTAVSESVVTRDPPHH